MTPEEQRTLDLFEAVESRPDINQRQLAEELGISLGLANAFLKRFSTRDGFGHERPRHFANYTFSLPREVWRKAGSL